MSVRVAPPGSPTLRWMTAPAPSRTAPAVYLVTVVVVPSNEVRCALWSRADNAPVQEKCVPQRQTGPVYAARVCFQITSTRRVAPRRAHSDHVLESSMKPALSLVDDKETYRCTEALVLTTNSRSIPAAVNLLRRRLTAEASSTSRSSGSASRIDSAGVEYRLEPLALETSPAISSLRATSSVGGSAKPQDALRSS